MELNLQNGWKTLNFTLKCVCFFHEKLEIRTRAKTQNRGTILNGLSRNRCILKNLLDSLEATYPCYRHVEFDGKSQLLEIFPQSMGCIQVNWKTNSSVNSNAILLSVAVVVFYPSIA